MTELQFHLEAWQFILAFKRRDVLAFHVPNGDLRDPRTASRLSRMGVVPGVADFCVIVDGRSHFVELKTATGRLSRHQHDFWEAATEAGAGYHIARSMPELIRILDGIGAIEPHPGAGHGVGAHGPAGLQPAPSA